MVKDSTILGCDTLIMISLPLIHHFPPNSVNILFENKYNNSSSLNWSWIYKIVVGDRLCWMGPKIQLAMKYRRYVSFQSNNWRESSPCHSSCLIVEFYIQLNWSMLNAYLFLITFKFWCMTQIINNVHPLFWDLGSKLLKTINSFNWFKVHSLPILAKIVHHSLAYVYHLLSFFFLLL